MQKDRHGRFRLVGIRHDLQAKSKAHQSRILVAAIWARHEIVERPVRSGVNV